MNNDYVLLVSDWKNNDIKLVPLSEEDIYGSGSKINKVFNSLEDITIRLGQIYVHLGDAINIETQISILAEVYPQLSDKAGELDLSMAKENVINESYIFKKDVGR